MPALPGRAVSIRTSGPQPGVTCCCGCVRCCACINWNYIFSRAGIIRILEVVMASMCESLAIKYGLPNAAEMGTAFEGYLSACCACLLGTTCLLFCFIFSEKSVGLVRSSLYETFHTGMCAFLLLSSSSSLMAAIHFYLWPRYLVIPFYQVFPAMSAASVLGAALGFLFAIDCYFCYRWYRGIR